MKFRIDIDTDNPDGEEVVRQALEKIACELDWSNDHTTNLEAVALSDLLASHPRMISAYYMEPGE